MEQLGGKKSNKITEIVRLQQMLKRWRKLSVTPKDTLAATAGGNGGGETEHKHAGGQVRGASVAIRLVRKQIIT